ncbi:cohesin domain-containing protein [Faecalicatena sp. AGMB00832]|uniref:Cohesin domain-containing protein n=1 Tax=Faecalicatena faecalis TaxID=2726362 RepID=A0ABS6CZI8_9FIRM|nr:cohesin domain-containing protein [Faecalicatena faecalis]MBU3874732.1 cohesin domain-containing protein [Faecalicatena faecalis]
MEKIFNKIGITILSLCVLCLCISFNTFAAEGTLQFSDPSVAAGEKVTVTAKVITGGAAVGDVDITVTYDTSILEFISGTNATGNDGTIQLSSKGDGSSDTAEFTMEFMALKEATTKIQATDYTAYLYSDESLNLSTGDSTVTIEGGTPVTEKENKNSSSGGVKVEIDGKSYTINEKFSEAAIPKGFTAAELELDGKPTKAMYQEVSGQYLYYLEDSEGNSDYFLYSTDDGSFSQTEVIDVNSDLSIYLMDHKDKEGLPSEFKETTTDIGGKVFTAWNNVSDKDYYLVYALSSDGVKGYYQYDSVEKTYQRYALPVNENKEKPTNTLTSKVMNFVEKYLTIIMCVIWGAFLLLLIIVIVLGVKLSHRNQEIDDLYDEYDLDNSQVGDISYTKKKSRKQFIDFSEDQDEYDYVEDDDYDDDFEDYDEEYDSDDLDEYSDEEYDSDDYDDDDFEDYDDEFFEEYDDESEVRKKKSDDDYSVNFIDI